MKLHEFRLRHPLRVRWGEVDAQKIVFNANYLLYLDVAVTEYWRSMALPYGSAMKRLGGEWYVKKATVEWMASAHVDDRLTVGMRRLAFGRTSMTMAGGVFRDGVLLASGELVYVFADPATQRPTPVPASLREAVDAWESGSPASTITTGNWDMLGADASEIRTQVFVAEQAIDAALEWDALDAGALHAVAYNRIGQPVATGRLLQPAPGVAQIGRMAVSRELRGTGVGLAVLDTLLDAAWARGDREAVLHAQHTAVEFYLRRGFKSRGEPFYDAGILHIEMHRPRDARQ